MRVRKHTHHDNGGAARNWKLSSFHSPLRGADSFIVLHTDTTSISVQWLRGDVSLWVGSRGNDHRVFAPW